MNPKRNLKRLVAEFWQRYSPRGMLLYFLPMPLLPAAFIALAKGQLADILVVVQFEILQTIAKLTINKKPAEAG